MPDPTTSPHLMTGLMKRARGAENVGLSSVPKPVAGPGQVLIEVFATGICGTDLHIQQDEYVSVPPVVMGHEITGRVVEAGEGAEVHLGKRVATESYF
jgi:L-iditol 2-dehydrogenase